MRGERGERGGGERSRNGYHHNRWSERDSLPPYERYHGGDGPFSREAEIGGDQGGWTWVSHRRRKASRPVWNGRDDSRYGYRHDGRFSSRLDNRWDSLSQQGYEDRTRHHHQTSQGRQHHQELGHAITEETRARNHKSRGRSLTRRDTTSFDRSLLQPSNDQGGKLVNSKVPGSTVFYISNFPEHLLFVDLKKGLEVCGILEDIYVSRYHNFYGQRFGFVKFIKVKDEHKLKKALNNVYFWDFKLFANIAKYDRFIKEEKDVKEKIAATGRNEIKSGSGDKQKGVPELEWRKKELEKVKEEAVRSERKREMESGGEKGGVENKVREASISRKEEVEIEEISKKEEEEDRKSVTQWRYLPLQEDVEWATASFFASIKNGLQVFAVQQALIDAGLEELKLIPMGGEKVLLRSNGQVQIKEVISNAADLLQNLLEDILPWSKEVETFNSRGAWVRCYGIPIHAWNPIFLAEVAETQGRLLRIDDTTLNKERLDFARILLSTQSKENIQAAIQVLIDELPISIRIIEEEGIVLAKDACLQFHDNDNFSLCSAHTGFHDNDQILEEFVQHLHEDWIENMTPFKEENNAKEDISLHQQNQIQKPSAHVSESKSVPSPAPVQVALMASKKTSKQISSVKNNTVRLPTAAKSKSTVQRQPQTNSVKQEVVKNTLSQDSVKRSSKKKILVPTVFGLKRLARLSEEERRNLIRSLKAIKRQNGIRSASKGAVKSNQNCTSLTEGTGHSSGSKKPKEWNHWTILHQGEKQVQKDIEEIGESIGVECHNSFEILARGRGKGKRKSGVIGK